MAFSWTKNAHHESVMGGGIRPIDIYDQYGYQLIVVFISILLWEYGFVLKKIIIALGLLLLLWAGLLSAGVETSKETFIGQTVADLTESEGSPVSVVVLTTGDSIWTYQLLKTNDIDCAEPTQSDNTQRTMLACVETETFLIDTNHIIKRHSTSVE